MAPHPSWAPIRAGLHVWYTPQRLLQRNIQFTQYSGPCGFSKHNTGWYTGVSASYVTIIPWSLIPWNYPGALWRKLEHDGFLTPWIWACPGKDTLLFGKGPYSPSRINRMVTTANANLRWRSLPLARITDLRGLSFASHTPTNIPVWRQLHI